MPESRCQASGFRCPDLCHPTSGLFSVGEGMRGRRPKTWPSAFVDGSPRNTPNTLAGAGLPSRPRKEVIQPQVPLRLPCYDFAPVADLTVVGCPPLLGQQNRLRV